MNYWICSMTLVLSLATPLFVIQVSDRRVVNGATGEIGDARANKSVLLGNQMAFGYTGLASLERQQTDYWLANVLSDLAKDVTIESAAQVIAYRAELAVRQFPKRFRTQAFVGVGWQPGRGLGEFVPTICMVTNFHDSNWTRQPTASDRFSVLLKTYQFPTCGWCSTGVLLTKGEHARLDRKIHACACRGLGPLAAARFMIDAIRQVSRRYGDPEVNFRALCVGRDLMLTVIPLAAAIEYAGVRSAACGLRLCPPSPAFRPQNEMYFAYLADAPGPAIDYSPHVVRPGELTLFGLEVLNYEASIDELNRKFLEAKRKLGFG